tara:strand:+ start:116 stop:349 length:234 start_codon:yes stop_codon:yes gene_type:complete
MKVTFIVLSFLSISIVSKADPECVNLAKQIDNKLKEVAVNADLKKDIIAKRDGGLMAMPTGKEACLKILNEGLDLFN